MILNYKSFLESVNNLDKSELILDKNGEPLKVYHGVRSGEHFDKFEKTSDIGFHFTPNKKTALGIANMGKDKFYSQERELGDYYEPIVYEGYIRAKSVEGIDDLEFWTVGDFRRYLNKLAEDNNIRWEYNQSKTRIENTRNLYSKIPGYNSNFDVLMYYNEYEPSYGGSPWSYILFDDSQFIRFKE